MFNHLRKHIEQTDTQDIQAQRGRERYGDRPVEMTYVKYVLGKESTWEYAWACLNVIVGQPIDRDPENICIVR